METNRFSQLKTRDAVWSRDRRPQQEKQQEQEQPQNQKQEQQGQQQERRSFPQAFQQNKRDRNEQSPYSSQDYQRWKRKEEKVDTKPPDTSSNVDFPTLGNLGAAKKPSAFDGISLADKLKQTIAAEQEEATLRRYSREHDEKNDKDIWIPLSLANFRRHKPEEVEKEPEPTNEDEDFHVDDWENDSIIQNH